MRRQGLFVSLHLVLLLVFFVPLLNFGEKEEPGKPRRGGVFHIKSFADTFRRQLDPIHPDSFIFLSEQLYDGLVRLDKELDIVPALAEYWEISPDGRVHTFHMRKGVKFHHGRELTAEDVKFSLERLLGRDSLSPYTQFFIPRVVGAKAYYEGTVSEVSGFRVRDKQTFEIQWTQPFASALYLLSLHICKILPKDEVLARGRGFFNRPSGTGPFIYDHWLRDTRLRIVGLRLKRNEDYYSGQAYLDAVDFCPLFRLQHFEGGEIESIPVISEQLLDGNYRIEKDGALNPVFLGMSCHLAPLDNLIIRRALTYGIDRAELLQAAADVRYFRQQTDNYIPSVLPGFFPMEERWSHDVEKAKSLLHSERMLDKRHNTTLTLLIEEPRTPSTERVYLALKGQLENLGFGLKRRYYDSLEDVKKYDQPYLILVSKLMHYPDPEDIVRPLFFSQSPTNIFGYANPLLDRLLEEAEVEHSWTKRINLFHRIEQILFADVPAVPLFFQQNRMAFQPYVRGLEAPPLGFYHLEARKIWLAQ